MAMLTVGELLHLLNTYQARKGLSSDAIVQVEIVEGDDSFGICSARTVACDAENQTATIYVGKPEQQQ